MFTLVIRFNREMANMKYWYQQPPPSLTNYVRSVLILEGFSAAKPSRHPLITEGMPTFLCRTEKNADGGEQLIKLMLFGKSADAAHWEFNEHATIIGYFMKPFAMASLFNLSAKQLLEGPANLFDWSPHKVHALKTQLFYADAYTQKIEILDHFLIGQLRKQQKECEIIRYATDQLLCNADPQVLSYIIKELKLNERTFQRIFKKYVGITPTQYRRICQFQNSFTQLKGKQFNKLVEVAYDNGFADQSHFTRSFREFTQTTPDDYLKEGLKRKKQ